MKRKAEDSMDETRVKQKVKICKLEIDDLI
jgi:hypothetical protein